MAERPPQRGGRGGGAGFRGGRGGARGGRGDGDHHHQGRDRQGGEKGERPKKENILDLSKYMDKKVNVQFNGGREVMGTLKGYDALMNLVLDEVQEKLRANPSPIPLHNQMIPDITGKPPLVSRSSLRRQHNFYKSIKSPVSCA